jgi:hypothetical protein
MNREDLLELIREKFLAMCNSNGEILPMEIEDCYDPMSGNIDPKVEKMIDLWNYADQCWEIFNMSIGDLLFKLSGYRFRFELHEYEHHGGKEYSEYCAKIIKSKNYYDYERIASYFN